MSSTGSLPQLFDNIRLEDDVQSSMSLIAVTFSTDPRDVQPAMTGPPSNTSPSTVI
jgi:hypothetical protein